MFPYMLIPVLYGFPDTYSFCKGKSFIGAGGGVGAKTDLGKTATPFNHAHRTGPFNPLQKQTDLEQNRLRALATKRTTTPSTYWVRSTSL